MIKDGVLNHGGPFVVHASSLAWLGSKNSHYSKSWSCTWHAHA